MEGRVLEERGNTTDDSNERPTTFPPVLDDIDPDTLSGETVGLLRAMERGLMPVDLSQHQYDLLVKAFGEDWFAMLGYDEHFVDRNFFDPKADTVPRMSRVDALLHYLQKGFLKPDALNKDEVTLLKEKYGPEWRRRLGFELKTPRKEKERERELERRMFRLALRTIGERDRYSTWVDVVVDGKPPTTSVRGTTKTTKPADDPVTTDAAVPAQTQGNSQGWEILKIRR